MSTRSSGHSEQCAVVAASTRGGEAVDYPWAPGMGRAAAGVERGEHYEPRTPCEPCAGRGHAQDSVMSHDDLGHAFKELSSRGEGCMRHDGL